LTTPADEFTFEWHNMSYDGEVIPEVLLLRAIGASNPQQRLLLDTIDNLASGKILTAWEGILDLGINQDLLQSCEDLDHVEPGKTRIRPYLQIILKRIAGGSSDSD